MIRKCLSTAVCCFLFLGGAQASEMTKDGEPNSFMTRSQLPDSLSILPSPPSNDSVAFLLDKAAYEQGRSLAGSDRWLQAINDANLSDENIGKPFSQALGVDISEDKTPITYLLLKKFVPMLGDLQRLRQSDITCGQGRSCFSIHIPVRHRMRGSCA